MNEMPFGSFAMSILPANVTIGKRSSVGSGVSFVVGKHLVEVNHNCVFTTNWDMPAHPEPITIGNDVWVGDQVTFLDGVQVGDGAIIGACTVVSKDVVPYSVVVGNPMRILRMRFTPEQIDRLEKIQWWNWSDELIGQRREEMKDITTFLQKYA